LTENYAEALKWFRLAADQGLADAQNSLGVMYHNGRGVPQNYAEAVKWYRLAADQGYAEAQTNLGVMYANGRGMPQGRSATGAIEWSVRMAALIALVWAVSGYRLWKRRKEESERREAERRA
jgi:TPR repeat protein